MNDFDVIVVGGGVAGGSIAGLLSKSGWRVAIVEKKPFPRRKVCGEFISATTRPTLDNLGVGEAYESACGPPVRKVALWGGRTNVEALLPNGNSPNGCGRAIVREKLDVLLLEKALEQGAQVFQPARVLNVTPEQERCTVELQNGLTISSKIVVLANGSWEKSSPLDHLTQPKRPEDLLAFKVVYRNVRMSPDLMPLVVYPGGYGGMVHVDEERVGLSLCIRRDLLNGLRPKLGEENAALTAVHYLRSSCEALEHALLGAVLDGIPLAAGPTQPGVRPLYSNRVFRVGNAAGEAHAVIAEGISMAIQSANLLASCLADREDALMHRSELDHAGLLYSHLWKRQFKGRIRAAHAFGLLAMSPQGGKLMASTVERLPALLTAGAFVAGKSKPLVLARA